ncbi:MAG: Glycosyl transferase group 1, partial [uncultured bacterium]
MKNFIKQLIIIVLSFIPRKKKNRIFTSFFARNYSGGPGRFLENLKNGLKLSNIFLERFVLSGCNSVLILSNSPGNLFLNFCKKKKIKTVLRADGFYLPYMLSKSDNRSLKLRKYREEINNRMQKDISMCDWIIYQSLFSKEMADQYLYNRTSNFSIIYNGVDTGYFQPVQKQNTGLKLLMLGAWRDPELFISSLNVFIKVNAEIACSLKIAGQMTKGVEMAYKKWLAFHADICPKIQYAGIVSYENLPSVINDCDVSLHLKSGDWCPNAVLETMACAIPVVCHNHGGTKELVGGGGEIIT